MRRPRHREKSTLLYKMLAVAALAGLALVPILIQAGALRHVQPLIPVHLVTVPPAAPAPKPSPSPRPVPKAVPVPQATRTPTRAAVPHPIPAPSVHTTPPSAKAMPVAPRPVRVAALPPRVPVVKPTHKTVTKPPRRTVKSAPSPVVREAHREHPAHIKHAHEKKTGAPPERQAEHERQEQAAQKALMEARKAKAARLEKAAHQMALAMAAHRAAQASRPSIRHTTAKSAHPASPPHPSSMRVAARPKSVPHPASVPPKRVAVNTSPKPASPPSAPSPVVPPPVTPSPQPPTPSPDAGTVPAPEFTSATPIYHPEPTVPERLLNAPLHAVCRVRFLVHPDGTATVQLLSSTGSALLDRRARQTARLWRFRPATRGGHPVESTMTVEFTFSVREVP